MRNIIKLHYFKNRKLVRSTEISSIILLHEVTENVQNLNLQN